MGIWDEYPPPPGGGNFDNDDEDFKVTTFNNYWNIAHIVISFINIDLYSGHDSRRVWGWKLKLMILKICLQL